MTFKNFFSKNQNKKRKKQFKKTMQKMHSEEQLLLEEYGFYMHNVLDPNDSSYMNIHTHGIRENFNHLDLQIVYPTSVETASYLFQFLLHHIKKGKSFENETILPNMLGAKGDYPIGFCKRVEGDRTVLRIILPDVEGMVTKDKMNPKYSWQFDKSTDFDSMEIGNEIPEDIFY